MLDKIGFDKWAGSYDKSIKSNSFGFPFEGYYNVLSYIQNSIVSARNASVLDLGIGTGLLSFELYKQGASITGTDFSAQMILEARKKMPNAQLYEFDFNTGLPENLKDRTFDCIISSYAFHHIDDVSKIQFIEELRKCLSPNGKILIGDVGFETEAEREKCRQSTGKDWDDGEYYFTGDTMVSLLNKRGIGSNYTQISICAGVLEIM